MIRDTLNGLTTEQQRQLMYAFENEFSQFIRLPDDKFIGVNINQVRNLKITESAGKWAYGDVK